MLKKPILQIRIPDKLSMERWALKEIFLRVGVPFTFVKEWDDYAIKIAYGFHEMYGADLILRERNKGWDQVKIPIASRIEGHDICHLATDRPTRLFSEQCFNIDIVGMVEYFLSARGIFHINKNKKTNVSDLGSIFNEPLLDSTCEILRQFINRLPALREFNDFFVDVWPDNKKVAIAITHDIDHLFLGGFSGFFYNIASGRTNEMLFHKQLIVSFKELVTYGLKRYFSPLQQCIELEIKNSIRATYFIYTGEKTFPYNPSYGFNDKVLWDEKEVTLKYAINEITDKGFEIGLHASTVSATDSVCLSKEVNKLEMDTGIIQPFGIRHHRLAFDPDLTPLIQSQLEIKYDSTLGFNGGHGFVSGTAYPFYLYCEKNSNSDRSIVEIPVTLQDFHLVEALKSGVSIDIIGNLLMSIEKGQGGVVNQIWHPERFLNKRHGKQLFNIYSEFLSNNRSNYWFATLSEIVDRWKDLEKKLFINNI